MTAQQIACILCVTLLPGLSAARAQQRGSAGSAPSHAIQLDVVVDAKSGQPVGNLTQQDFTILDNKHPLPIVSFKAMNGAAEPVEVILFIDAVNTPFQLDAYMREGIKKFLLENEGKLAYPTAIAILGDRGAQINNGFSTNGIVLDDALAHQSIELREINRDAQWGGDERLQISLTAFQQLLAYTSTLPGRKMILWVSPGWPLISGPQVYLTPNQERQIFDTIVSYSTQMRQNNVTLYNINPIGAQESFAFTNYYQSFLNGVAKPGDVMPGNLGVQVLAVQSGGLAIESNSDVTGNIQRCLADLQAWYEITLNPPPGDKPNEYHHIVVKVNQRGLVARTRDGYYSNPTTAPAQIPKDTHYSNPEIAPPARNPR